MKKWFIGGIILLLVSTNIILAQRFLRTMYVNVDSENLRLAPQGKKIAALDRGTQVDVIEETDKWVRVQVTGWIWKGSLSNVVPPRPGEIRASHIMVNSEVKANEIVAAIKAGKDFGELAKQNSLGPSASRGGDLGLFLPDDFDPAFAAALKKLQVGDNTGIIKKGAEYHIFLRTK